MTGTSSIWMYLVPPVPMFVLHLNMGMGQTPWGTKTNSWSCFGLESTIHFFGVHDFDPCDSILSYYVNVKSNFQTQSDEHDMGPVKLS